ncbi:hypothetical protein B0T10DRAFT_526316 [Thelonectria olida]|uniref:Zn(2)-C6 fungal-type domain-containing protein n=1 Tax=Thelonectria olida TaxID=1576542 RepID=A0A9P8WGJ3_9HYPO|nr:hypothetical protein B0T10DRAFT_526316 [Thelonectria olida]
MDGEAPLLRRLNGRPQACDQCRARKVACDHGQPTCNRCRKRRQTCVYTVAAAAVAPKPKRTRSAAASLPRPRSENSTPTPPCSGYLGFTSHSTVFEETRTSLTLANGALEVEPKRPWVRCSPELPQPLREMSLYVLRHLPRPSDELSYENTPCRPDSWILKAVKRIIRTLHDIFGPHLDSDEASLEECAHAISVNTARPFREDNIDAQDWMDQFAGDSLRWESIALIWTFWETRNVSAIGLSLKYCIELASYFTSSNDLILYLCYRRSTMESIIRGDASLECWRCHGETVSMMTFLGLHAQRDSPTYRPTLISENRRRIFAQVFNIDKVMVSFTGRPPLISRRYASTPLPLDLRDDDLIAGGDTLARAIDMLDEHGWNTDGRLHSSTLLRARGMIAYIREQLLEIALGTRYNNTLDQLLAIKERQITTVSQFPSSLTFRPEDLNDASADTDRLCTTLLLKLEHLQNLFFVERLMLRFGGQDAGQLLVTSFEMVSLTLTIWTHQDRFASIRRDFEWLEASCVSNCFVQPSTALTQSIPN